MKIEKAKPVTHFPVTKLLVHKTEALDGKAVYVAESVDYCLAAQASSLEALWRSFGHVYYGTVLVSFEHNQPVRFGEPFEDVVNRWATLSERKIEPDMRIPWSLFRPHWLDGAMGKLAGIFGSRTETHKVEVRFREGPSRG